MSSPQRTRVVTDTSHYLVERGGSGPTVLLLNGTGTTIASSQVFIELLRRNADVIAFDYRGMGGSSTPPGPWTMADYAYDVRAILDGLEVSSCILLGVSFGGMVAQEFAVTFPSYVQKLALWSTSAGGIAGSSYPLHELDKLSKEELEEFTPKLADSRFSPQWLEENPKDRALLRASEPLTGEQLHVMGLQLGARSGHDVSDRISAITSPVLVGVGKFDIMAPPENAHAIGERIKQAAVHEYEGGHLFFFQDKNALKHLGEFIGTSK
jgi:pimeloyl-ACP methyl ester carboxylesterase